MLVPDNQSRVKTEFQNVAMDLDLFEPFGALETSQAKVLLKTGAFKTRPNPLSQNLGAISAKTGAFKTRQI